MAKGKFFSIVFNNDEGSALSGEEENTEVQPQQPLEPTAPFVDPFEYEKQRQQDDVSRSANRLKRRGKNGELVFVEPYRHQPPPSDLAALLKSQQEAAKLTESQAIKHEVQTKHGWRER